MFDRLKKKMGLGRQTYPVHFAAMPQTAEVHEPDHQPLDFACRGVGVTMVPTMQDAFLPLSPAENARLRNTRAQTPIAPSEDHAPSHAELFPLPPARYSPIPGVNQTVPAPAPPSPSRTRSRSAVRSPQLSVVVERDEGPSKAIVLPPKLRLRTESRVLQRAAMAYASSVLAQLASPDSGYHTMSEAADNSDTDSFYYDQFDLGSDDQKPPDAMFDPNRKSKPSKHKRPRLPQDRIGIAK